SPLGDGGWSQRAGMERRHPAARRGARRRRTRRRSARARRPPRRLALDARLALLHPGTGARTGTTRPASAQGQPRRPGRSPRPGLRLPRMKIAISATNPCHLYDLAKAWHALDALGAYHSGYPGWRLRPPAGFPLRAHSWRTVVTYAALRLSRALRPRDPALFRWQDDGFDRAVAGGLRATDGEVVHALPGQALHTFRAARRLGVETCLNHASGPLARQHAILAAVAAETGGPPPSPPSAVELERRAAETALADWHCVASGVVRDQLIADGVPADRIWLAPYAADSACF